MLEVEDVEIGEDLEIVDGLEVQPFEVDGFYLQEEVYSVWREWYFYSSEGSYRNRG